MPENRDFPDLESERRCSMADTADSYEMGRSQRLDSCHTDDLEDIFEIGGGGLYRGRNP